MITLRHRSALRHSLSTLIAASGLAAAQGAGATVTQDYTANLRVPLASAANLTATVHVHLTCEKIGIGVAGNQVCDDPGWGPDHSFSVDVPNVPIDLGATGMNIDYFERAANAGSSTHFSLDRLSGALGDASGGTPVFTVHGVPGMGDIPVQNFRFGERADLPWALDAWGTHDSNIFSPIDGGLYSYQVSMRGATRTSVHAKLTVSGSNGMIDVDTPMGDGDARGVETILEEYGADPSGRPIYRLGGTAHLWDIPYGRDLTFAGSGFQISEIISADIPFLFQGTATTALPLPTYAGTVNAFWVDDSSGGPVSASDLTQVSSSMPYFGCGRATALVDWGDGSPQPGTCFMGEFPPLSITSAPAGNVINWGANDIVSYNATMCGMARQVYTTLRVAAGLPDETVFTSASTVYGPVLWTDDYYSGAVEVGAAQTGLVLADVGDSRVSTVASDLSAFVDFGNGTVIDCAAEPEACHVVSNDGWDFHVVGTHTWTEPGPYSASTHHDPTTGALVCPVSVKTTIKHVDGRVVVSSSQIDLPCASVGCSDGVSPGDGFSATMVGCKGTLPFASAALLCGEGWAPCSANQWAGNHNNIAPTYNYWTSDVLGYSGSGSNACSATTTSSDGCIDTPMRVCAGGTDSLGNVCNWSGCGLDGGASDYFGGCYGNTTAGTLCCQQ